MVAEILVPIGIILVGLGIITGLAVKKIDNLMLLGVGIFFMIFGVGQLFHNLLFDSTTTDSITTVLLVMVIAGIVTVLWIIPLIKWAKNRIERKRADYIVDFPANLTTLSLKSFKHGTSCYVKSRRTTYYYDSRDKLWSIKKTWEAMEKARKSLKKS